MSYRRHLGATSVPLVTAPMTAVQMAIPAPTTTKSSESTSSGTSSGGGTMITHHLDPRHREIIEQGPSAADPQQSIIRQAAQAKIEQGAARIKELTGGPFARPAYCADFADTRYRAMPAVARQGSILVFTGQNQQIDTAAKGRQWAQAALENALYLVGYKRAYQRIAQPYKVGTRSEPRLLPFDAGFELSADGRFRTAWIAVQALKDVNAEEMRGIIRRMGTLANQKAFGRTGQWLAVGYVLEPEGFQRILSTTSTLSAGGYFNASQPIPRDALPAWLPPQKVPYVGGTQTITEGSRFDPAAATRTAYAWTPTGHLGERPFYVLAILQRKIRDSDWISFDGQFAEAQPNGSTIVGVITSIAPSKIGSKSVGDMTRQISDWARELTDKDANDIRNKAGNAVQRVAEAYDIVMPAAVISTSQRPWGNINNNLIPGGASCAPPIQRTAPPRSYTAHACGVQKEWQNLQRDDVGVWRGFPWGYGAMVRRQPLARGPRGVMSNFQAHPYSAINWIGHGLTDLPAAVRVPSRTRLQTVALQAEGVIADFAVIFQAMLGGLAAARTFARRVLNESEQAKVKLAEAIQIANSAPSLRETLVTRARGYLRQGASMDEAAQFFAEAKAAVDELIGKLRAAIQMAGTRVWARPEEAYGMIVATLQQGVAAMEARVANAPQKIRDRVKCFYLEKAEEQLGPMTDNLRGDLEELPALSEQVGRLGPGGLAALEQLAAELRDIESQVGIPWYLKRGPLKVPVYGWLGVAGLTLIGSAAWAVNRKKKRKKGQPPARKRK